MAFKLKNKFTTAKLQPVVKWVEEGKTVEFFRPRKIRFKGRDDLKINLGNKSGLVMIPEENYFGLGIVFEVYGNIFKIDDAYSKFKSNSESWFLTLLKAIISCSVRCD